MAVDNKAKNQKKREKQRLKKLEKQSEPKLEQPSQVKFTQNEEEPQVIIEYVQPDHDDVPEEFRDIFSHFLPKEEPDSGDEEAADAAKANKADKQHQSDDDDDFMEDDEDEDALQQEAASKRKLKKMNRPSVALLKQSVAHPEFVEWWDVSATDPKLLIQLKAYRNTVAVPPHWSYKRKYLQGKRGLDKPPFELPHYIADTGIGRMRDSVALADSGKTMKAKMRAKMHPKLGKLSIDYARLHDAFFRFQTKPSLSLQGELYHEGKEYSIVLKEKKPGVLSQELKDALGMTHPLLPPPWLVNQQRFGPPPSYSHLKIPGLNSPIPEGAQWGYHPGGWGKPPVDEYNRPLYGDVFGMYTEYQKQLQHSIEASNLTAPVDRTPWGEITALFNEDDKEEEDEEAEQQESVEQIEEMDIEDSTAEEGTRQQPVATGPLRTQKIDTLEIEQTPIRKTVAGTDELPAKSLYTVLKTETSTNGVGLMGSQHAYVVPSATTTVTASAPTDRKRRKFADSIEVTLQPEELEQGIDQEALERKYASEINKQKNAEFGGGTTEDVSDLMGEHLKKQQVKVDQAKKRKADTGGKFKF